MRAMRRRATRIIAGAALAVACLIGGYAFSGADETAAPPDAIGKFRPAAPAAPVPTASFTDRAGNPVSLEDLRGKVVILNVWATWCPPCIKEMPSLAALAATLDPAEVTLLAVSEDIQGETMVGPFLAARDLSALAIRLDPKNTLLKAFHLRGLPTTVILDAQGRELGRLEGGTDWSTAYIRELIRSYIGTGSAKPPAVSKT